MNGLRSHPGRDGEGLCVPGSHRVTGWAAISLSSRAASSSRVSPSNTRFPAFRMRLGCVFLTKLIEVSPDVESCSREGIALMLGRVVENSPKPAPQDGCFSHDAR